MESGVQENSKHFKSKFSKPAKDHNIPISLSLCRVQTGTVSVGIEREPAKRKKK